MADEISRLCEGKEYAEVRHENVLLKTELMHTIQRNEQNIKELKLIHQSQIIEFEDTLKNLEKRCQLTQEQSVQDQKYLQQTNIQLNQRLKLLEAELTAANQNYEKEHQETQHQYSQYQLMGKRKEEEFQQMKEMNIQLNEKVSALETELDRERSRCHEYEITLSSERHQMKMLATQVDEIEQQCQGELTLARTEAQNYKRQIKTLEENFQKRLEEVRESLELEKNLHEEAKEKIFLKDGELKRMCNQLKEAHLTETEALLKENGKLLRKIQEFQQKDILSSDATTGKNKIEDLTKELTAKTEELFELKKDIALLQTKVKESEETKKELIKEKTITGKLHEEAEEVVTQLKKYQKENAQLQTLNKCLNESFAEKDAALRTLMQEVQKERTIHQQMLTDAKIREEEHTSENRSRISLLESQLVKKSQEYVKEVAAMKEKVKQYGALIKKLRYRLESAAIKEREMTTKQDVFKEDFVPSYRYRALQQQLQRIVNKHSEFKAFIQGLAKNHNDITQFEDLKSRMTFVNDKLLELESAQNEAYSAIGTL